MEIYHETKSELLNEAFGEVEPPRTSERRRSTRQAAQEVEEDEEVMGPSQDVKRIYNSSTHGGYDQVLKDIFIIISKGCLSV